MIDISVHNYKCGQLLFVNIQIHWCYLCQDGVWEHVRAARSHVFFNGTKVCVNRNICLHRFLDYTPALESEGLGAQRPDSPRARFRPDTMTCFNLYYTRNTESFFIVFLFAHRHTETSVLQQQAVLSAPTIHSQIW